MKKPPNSEDTFTTQSISSSYQTIKTRLKSIVRSEIVIEKLTKTAIMANRIMIHCLNFIKLYMIHCYDNNLELPIIDKLFVTSVMKIMCVVQTRGRPPKKETKELKKQLSDFYNTHYKYLRVDNAISYLHMNTILDYMAIEVITMYENNIKQHFVEYVERYVNIIWDKKGTIEEIKTENPENKKEQIRNICNSLTKVKNDLLSPEEKTSSDVKYHAWINEELPKILPKRKLQKGSVYYDIKCSPQDYFHSMIYMMKEIEARGEKIKNVFPLRSQIIPKHFRLDTTSLVLTCMTKEQQPSSYLVEGNLVKYQDKIWNFFFKTNKKCFHRHKDKHEFTFDHMIETDGVSCCILLKRREKIKVQKEVREEVREEVYIDEVKDYTTLQDKKVVAIDPNMSDLLYCVNSDVRENQTIFRYTQDTRRKETKVKKYRNLLQAKKERIIDGKTVVKCEAELSEYNKKTLNFDQFKGYLSKKNELNKRLEKFYGEYLFRKLKLGSYMRRQITEARLLKHFKEKFGDPEDTIITIGDFEQRKHRKFKEPVKGKGFRTTFRKAGYKVYLVEIMWFRTSCRCSVCQGECTTFRKCNNPRPWRSEEVILRHGLVKSIY